MTDDELALYVDTAVSVDLGFEGQPRIWNGVLRRSTATGTYSIDGEHYTRPPSPPQTSLPFRASEVFRISGTVPEAFRADWAD